MANNNDYTEYMKDFNPEDYNLLSDTEKAFAQAYVKNGGNGMAAMKAARPNMNNDSAKVYAYQLLNGVKKEQNKHMLKAYIGYLKQIREQAAIMDTNDVVARILKVYDMAMENEKFNDANKAMENLSRVLGLWDNRKTQTVVEKDTSGKDSSDSLSEKDEEIVDLWDETGIEVDSIN